MEFTKFGYYKLTYRRCHSSSDVDKYFTGRKSSIASRLELKTKDSDELVKCKKGYEGA
jgi:hypothetical protein